MAVIKVNKTKDYTIMSNTHFREREMSLKAKGLLSLMLSLPSDWDYSIDGLVAICKENETAITSTLKELKSFGYLSVTKVMPNETKSGRIEYVYEIYETPNKENIQGLENQGVEKQDLENLPLVLQKEKSSKKEKDIYIYSNNIEEENTKDKKEKEITKEKPHRTRKEFVHPTYDEVLAYAKVRGREDLARKFFDYFDAGDWIDSKGNKVRNWKQKFIVWESSNKKSKDSSLQQTDTEEVNELFNVFWEAYPNKANIVGAKTSFKRIANLQTEFPLIMEALERFKKSKQWTKQNGEFIPLPTSWLDQQRWKDEHIETREDKLKRLDMSDWL